MAWRQCVPHQPHTPAGLAQGRVRTIQRHPQLPAAPLTAELWLLERWASWPHPLSGPQLAPCSPLFTQSSFALCLFPAVTLSGLCWVALTLPLCFQDFRKYEEGFDPYSMVRDNSPPPGQSQSQE